MRLYRRSNTVVDAPDVSHSREATDFGEGFYATTLQEQAERWCQRFTRFGEQAVPNWYELDETVLSSFDVVRFDRYSAEWLDFVTSCRMGRDATSHDVIVGGVANDRVFNTCELYFKGYIDKDTALDRLRFEKPTNQYCFRTQGALDACLKFGGSELK